MVREAVLSSMRSMVRAAIVFPARRRERRVGAVSNRILKR
jgi:hypothetical protein